MKNTLRHFNVTSVLLSILFGISSGKDARPITSTHSHLDFAKNGITIESQLAPELLRNAGLITDLDGDGQINAEELHAAKERINAFVTSRIDVFAGERLMAVDSSSILFCFSGSDSQPVRIDVFCWYALLLRPERVAVRNRLFSDQPGNHKNYGTFVSNGQAVDFEFPQAGPEKRARLEFELLPNGRVNLVNDAADASEAAMVWFSAGLAGLVVLTIATRIRKRLKEQVQMQQQASAPAKKVDSQAVTEVHEMETLVG